MKIEAIAGAKIQKIVSSIKRITSNLSREIIVLKLKLKTLENRLISVNNEKIELEKLLADFQCRHSKELGDILLDILRIRMLIFQFDKSKFDEAEKDERQFREQVQADRKQQKHRLTDDEKKELKKKFRKASIFCHPDKVNDKFKESAQEIFIRLKKAYDSNDLKKVAEILSNLEKGSYFESKSNIVSKKEQLKAEITNLRNRIKSQKTKILWIKKGKDYKTVIAINDWDAYFRNMKAKLERELKEMKKQIEV